MNKDKCGTITVSCKQCGCAFKSSPSRIRNGRSTFCSRVCSSLWKSATYKGRPGNPRYGVDNPNWKGVRRPKPCPICGTVFTSPTLTCSVTCGHKLQAQKITKEGNPNYKTEEVYLESESRYRQIIDPRRLKSCEECGTSTRQLVVHHIDEDRFHNIDSNLRVLCYSCHTKVHPNLRYSDISL